MYFSNINSKAHFPFSLVEHSILKTGKTKKLLKLPQFQAHRQVSIELQSSDTENIRIAKVL
jgi:hypothetical protein